MIEKCVRRQAVRLLKQQHAGATIDKAGIDADMPGGSGTWKRRQRHVLIKTTSKG